MFSTGFPRTRQFFTIALIYAFCYGLTANLITPVQQIFLSEETLFASLMYLPHGVRVLSVMLYGWRAIPALMAGNFLSVYLFAAPEVLERDLIQIVVPVTLASSSGWIAFEIFRLFGKDYYASENRSLHWRQIVLVGMLASVVNSLGQSILLGQVFALVDNSFVFLMFAVGDLLGLLVSLLVLMLVFRWLRRGTGTAQS
ncbi:hypothetical protein [Roseobacter ponti]|uniref:MASE1 domain-containing protein n=1 Tax=Roseobacter ponti TaxID=1891787 RepID=A0A858SU36_9RHOB|nr:hypothetical protein [Roseobacter ponti]QJF51820.1 hypothetical protein G3256_11925 [Roseobacter ponti]